MSITPPPPYSHPEGTLVAEPAKPVLRVDVDLLPKLISSPVVLEHISPWIDPSLRLAELLQRDSDPPWSAWLESYYRMYHPGVWVQLEEDHERQKEYLFRLAWWRRRRMSEGVSSEVLDGIWTEMVKVQEEMMTRISQIYGRFLTVSSFFPS
ncbi:hypothetical protein JCM8097_001679 [Rhodosporidiobolus ruineniae]